MRHILGVLISVYRAEDPFLFERALKSVVDQRSNGRWKSRIYLGVDGPVTPELDAVIRTFDRRIYKILRFEVNRGLASVLNDLINAREDEEFFFRMDTDDVSHPDRFSRQLDYMLCHPEIDILGTDIVECSSLDMEGSTIVHFADNPADARRNIAWGVPVAHPTVCFRADVFDRVPGYPLIRLNEDISMWFECLKVGMNFDNLPEPLYYFTITENFWARRGIAKAWQEFKAYAYGLWTLEGLTWRYAIPAARLMFRLLPRSVQKIAYKSDLRQRDVRHAEAVPSYELTNAD